MSSLPSFSRDKLMILHPGSKVICNKEYTITKANGLIHDSP